MALKSSSATRLLLGLSMLRTATPYYAGLPRPASQRLICMGGGGKQGKKGGGGGGGGFGKPAKPPAQKKAAGFSSVAAPKDTFKYTGKMRPGRQTPRREIPSSIIKPDYADDGRPKATGPMLPWQIEVKSAKDIEGMRVAGRVAREVLDAAGQLAKPGVATDEIDALVHEQTLKRGAYPSPLNYHGFPKSCCTSVNEVICHGIPDSYVLVRRRAVGAPPRDPHPPTHTTSLSHAHPLATSHTPTHPSDDLTVGSATATL